MRKISFMSVTENRAKLTAIKREAGLRTVSCGKETLPMMIAAVQSNQPRASLVMHMARIERFCRIVADVDKQDIKRYSDFINQKLYDLLLRAQAVAKAIGGVILEPFVLPITKGLQECIHGFARLDEEIELRPILNRLAAHPPLDLVYGEDVEARLPEIVGGLSIALARTFNIIDPGLKNPSIGGSVFVFSICCCSCANGRVAKHRNGSRERGESDDQGCNGVAGRWRLRRDSPGSRRRYDPPAGDPRGHRVVSQRSAIAGAY
ncbi:DUF1931 family protein [Bradyrhizobium brasilense]|uniref:DUF1931 family protein n=1 Tax=Bradyrhizobium brasilense TaxID=1419277 RepID=UPI0024B18BD8|nr:DUF1931 family protein [Bradyrhizobium australafricanum]WFU34352.1 DUF1931 family protein [Bradyrhizobium australafricanum]